MRDWADRQAEAGCYSWAALSSNDSKTRYAVLEHAHILEQTVTSIWERGLVLLSVIEDMHIKASSKNVWQSISSEMMCQFVYSDFSCHLPFLSNFVLLPNPLILSRSLSPSQDDSDDGTVGCGGKETISKVCMHPSKQHPLAGGV